MKNLSFKAKLMMLAGCAVLSLAVFAAGSFLTLSKVEVGSPTYNSIVMIKDVNADFLPPTQSLAVGVVHAVQMEEAPDLSSSRHFQDLLRQDHKDFEDGHTKWMEQLPEGRLKELVGGPSYAAGKEWFDVLEQEFVPAILAGERQRAHQIRLTKMAKQYAAQVTIVNEIVQVTNDTVAGEQAGIAAVVRSRTRILLVVGLIALAVILGLSYLIARGILDPLRRTLHVLEALAAGDLRQQVEVDSTDEIGTMGTALNRAIDGMASAIESIVDSAGQVTSASEQLNVTSQQITANSQETSAQADVVSKAAQEVSRNLQTVATGAEEMGASIKEIAKNATEAANIATSAVKVAETATATVSKLGDSSHQIGEVIKVITSIAQQTNLLALNATIEAARAGEAGKGFAVVANEVKELARETANATTDISLKIETIQADTTAAVAAIASISKVIHQVNDISSTIAAAVEEQNATTNEMSRNVSDAAQGSGEITSNISGVAEAAQSTTHGATETQNASQALVETSAQLRRLVEQFKFHSRGRSTDSDSAPSRGRAAASGA